MSSKSRKTIASVTSQSLALSCADSRAAVTLLPLHDQFLRAGQYLRNWSGTTLRTYRQGLQRLALERPTKTDLDAWVVRLREQGLTPGGVTMYARAVNSYLRIWPRTRSSPGMPRSVMNSGIVRTPSPSTKPPALVSDQRVRVIRSWLRPPARTRSWAGGSARRPRWRCAR